MWGLQVCMICKECTWGSNYSARFSVAPCILGAFPLAILLRPRYNKSFFIQGSSCQSIHWLFLKYDREVVVCIPVLFIVVIKTHFSVLCWQFMFYFPWSVRNETFGRSERKEKNEKEHRHRHLIATTVVGTTARNQLLLWLKTNTWHLYMFVHVRNTKSNKMYGRDGIIGKGIPDVFM